MFDRVLNTPFNANQLTGFYLIQIFTEKFFPNKLWKKSTRKLSSWKEILSWMICNFSVIQQKMPWLIWVYIGSFSVYISHFFDITKTGIDEIVNFGNLRKLFTNKCTTFLWHFGTPSSNGKNETQWQGKWNMLQWPPLVHWGS